MANLQDKRFGRLLVLYRGETKVYKSGKYKTWHCICDCGQEKDIIDRSLVSGHTQSCGCIRNENNKNNHFILSDGQAGFNYLYYQYKKGAIAKGLTFELTHEEFLSLTKMNCYYCGIEPLQEAITDSMKKRANYNGNYLYNGIDRRNNIKGYTVENCVPCCKICNYFKKNMLEIEFLNHVNRIYRYQKVNYGKFDRKSL
jgi:hypothetical protein